MKRFLFIMVFIFFNSLIFLYNDASADNQKFTNITIAGKVIKVLLPTGFVNGLENFPQFRSNFEHLLTVKENKILAAFFTQEDVGRLLAGQEATFDKLIIIEIPKQWEDHNFRKQDFVEIKRMVNKDNFIQTITTDEKILNLVKEKDAWLKQANNGFGLEFNKMIPLGTFYQDDNSIGNAIFSKMRVKLPDQEIKSIVEVRSMCLILRATKCFSVRVSSVFNSEEDINWVYSTSKRIMTSY